MKGRMDGFALLMVLAFLLIIGLLIAPLVTVVGQVSSATVATEKVPAKEEAKAAAVNLVRYAIANSANCPNDDICKLTLAQGDLQVNELREDFEVQAFGDTPAYRYWSFHVGYTLKSRSMESHYSFTGTAVQFVMSSGGNLDDYIYIVDITED